MDGSVREREQRETGEEREDTVWPIDQIKLRPFLLCGSDIRVYIGTNISQSSTFIIEDVKVISCRAVEKNGAS